MTDTAEALLAAYESRLRGRLPSQAPMGATVERDGPLVRTHFGTHGTVDHTVFECDGTEELLIRRQQQVSAERCEPVEWKVHSNDSPLLAPALRAAGFAPGPERVLLAAAVGDVPPPGPLRQGTRTDDWPRGLR